MTRTWLWLKTVIEQILISLHRFGLASYLGCYIMFRTVWNNVLSYKYKPSMLSLTENKKKTWLWYKTVMKRTFHHYTGSTSLVPNDLLWCSRDTNISYRCKCGVLLKGTYLWFNIMKYFNYQAIERQWQFGELLSRHKMSLIDRFALT